MYVSIMAQAFCFNLFNGYLQGRQVAAGDYPTDHLLQLTSLMGVLIFLVGWFINYQSDDILRNLRAPGEKGYKIPRGGAFEWVTAANYFGEIVEWAGWALATFSVAGLSFAFFTFANLAPRARDHHAWYQKKFGSDYPPKRRAIIPYLW